MATNRPDPGEFLEFAQRMLRELFGNQRDDDDEPWADATRSERESWAGERTYGSAQRNRDFLRGLGKVLDRPKAIVAVSAHWDTEGPQTNAPPANDTIHDFRGFPRQLRALRCGGGKWGRALISRTSAGARFPEDARAGSGVY